MSALAAPWVKETSATTGTGVLILTGKVEKYIRFNMGFSAGAEVWYSIEDSNGNREAGIGVFNGTNQLTRQTIHSTLVSGVFNDINPTAINLSGNSVVTCTFNANAYNELVTDISATQSVISTGILYGGVLSINATDNSKFDISAGKGVILDASTPNNPLVKTVEWGNIEGVTVTNIATADSSSIAINSLGTVVQSSSGFSSAQVRSLILLGGLSHSNNVSLDTSFSLKAPSYNIGASLKDLATALGLINQSGNNFSANGANLLINRSSGAVFAYGQNFDVNPNNPHHVTTADSLGEVFLRVHGDGSGNLVVESVTDTVNPDSYDSLGTLTAVPTNRWSNIRLYVYPNTGTNVVRYGSAHYATKADALNALLTESVTEIKELETAVLRGWLTVQEGATALNNQTESVFTSNNGNVGGGSGTPSTGMTALVDDSNPQLGGDLDTNSFNILMDAGATVDGRDVSEDGAKLDTIESNATADQTPQEIEAAYESLSNTNKYTDADKTRVSNLGTATTTIQGLVELATNAESQVGTDTSRVITPSSMSHKLETLGLGTEDLVDNYAGNDANTLPYTGRFFLVNAQNVPSAGNWFIDYAFTNGTNFSSGFQYAVRSGSTRVYFRQSVSSVWQPWLELYHTGNNIDARQYGIGINEQDKDNDTVVGTQIFRSRTDQGATLPTGISSAHTLYMQRAEDGQASQLIVEDRGALPNDPYMGFRVRGNGTGWGGFFEILHEGSVSRLAASQAEALAGTDDNKVMTSNRTRQAYTQWGLGSEASNNVTDWDNAVRNGFYRSVGANAYINSPDNSASGWQGIVSSLDSNSKRQLLWRGGGDGKYQMWTRERFQGSWTPWIQLLTEANTNLSKFGFKANGILAKGVGVNGVTASFHLPLNSLIPPTSITLTGTFSLLDILGTVIRAAIPASDIAFVVNPSTGKIAQVDVNNNSGLIVNTTYLLRSETGTSGIEVNF